MSQSSSDIGILTTLAQRLVDQKLPRTLALKQRIDSGELLEDADIAFLEQGLADARSIVPILERHPEYVEIAGRMGQLFNEIMAKALTNEQAKKN